MIEPGSIYFAWFPSGRRPVVVISREKINRGSYLLVAACTSQRRDLRGKLPNCVPLKAGEFGMTTDCVVQCENIASLEIADLDLEGGSVGCLDSVTMRSVIRAIGYVIESECEPE